MTIWYLSDAKILDRIDVDPMIIANLYYMDSSFSYGNTVFHWICRGSPFALFYGACGIISSLEIFSICENCFAGTMAIEWMSMK